MLTLLFGVSQSFFCAFGDCSIISIFFTRVNHPPELEALNLRREAIQGTEVDGSNWKTATYALLVTKCPHLSPSAARLLYRHETENPWDRGSIKIFCSRT